MSIKLKKAFKKQWLAALRSGEYQQGRTALHCVDKEGSELFCCLGVACKLVADKFGGIGITRIDDCIEYDGQGAYPPPSVLKRMLTEECFNELPAVIFLDNAGGTGDIYSIESGNANTDTIPLMNDSGGYSFGDIADLIEAQY